MAVKKMAQGIWHVSVGGDQVMKMVSWTTLEDQPYTTYLRVAGS